MRSIFLKIPILLLVYFFQGCAPKSNPYVLPETPPTNGGVTLRPKNTTPAVPLKLEWVSPKPLLGEIVPVYKKLNIEVRAYTTASLTDKDFTVIIDEKRLGTKAGEEPLKVLSKEEYIFRKTIDDFPDAEGQQYSVKVEVNNGGKLELSRTILIRTTSTPPKLDITWKKPDVTELDGKVFFHTDPYLEFSANIDAGGTALNVKQLRLKYNGNIIEPSKDAVLQPSGSRYSFKDRLALLNSQEVQTLSILVENVESEILKIRYSPGKKPNLYVLSVGPQTNLQFTVQDAVDFANIFQSQTTGNSLYSTVFVEPLLKADASKQGICDAVNLLKTKMKTDEISPSDLVILFLSTHGFMLENEFRLQGNDYNSAKEFASSVSFNDDILKVIKSMPCKKLVFMDACHSGGSFDAGVSGGRATASEVERALEKFNEYRSGLAIVASSSGDETSYEDKGWGNGAFTEAIIKGLKEGKADGKVDTRMDGIITVNELYNYLKKEVPGMVKQVKGKTQTPRMYDPDKIGDIPIYVVKK